MIEIAPQKYIRNPIEVEAIRVTDANFAAVLEWAGGTEEKTETPVMKGSGVLVRRFIQIEAKRTLFARQTTGYIGDWILKNDKGCRVYTDAAFRAAFQLSLETEGETEESGLDEFLLVDSPDDVVLTPVAPENMTE